MNNRYSILVIDDEKNQRQLLGDYVEELGHTSFQAASVLDAKRVLAEEPIDLVLSDYRLGDGTGEDVLDFIQEKNPLIQFILFTAYGSIKRAVDFMARGAADYLAKPLDLDELEVKIKIILRQKTVLEENIQMRQALEEKKGFSPLIFKSRSMEDVVNLALRAARSNASILISGESGTGKELLAQAIHRASPRSAAGFIAVNCTALNENVLESELFGHEKGSFTGAERQRIGRFEEARGGTLFLDEIGEISTTLQVKLLRVLQDKMIQRIGSNQNISVDFRLIVATNQNLQESVSRGTFRNDLYYRLNVIHLKIPPLRERKEDIPLLLEHFIKKYAADNQQDVRGLTNESLHLMMRHTFPGNVRELENLVERAVVLSRSTLLEPDDFPDLQQPAGNLVLSKLWSMPLSDAVEQLERIRIERALEEAGFVQTQAAEQLGINERNLRYKMDKYGIPSRRKK